ncbi:hypothetical protein pb186bvf_006529 [Paramecium bursaria]
MKVLILVLIVLALSSDLNGQSNLRQDYKFSPWSLDCTNKCQQLGGVVCGYPTQICCRNGQCHKGWKEEKCPAGQDLKVHLCLPGPV